MRPIIEIERRGKILQGRWAGRTIFVQDDRQGTGGYLILIGGGDKGEDAGDVWIEAGQLEAAFAAAGWEVEWQDSSIGRNQPVVDLDAAAKVIEDRLHVWRARGLEVGPLTWRDEARGWPWQLVSRKRAHWPDSVGFRVRRGPAMGAVVLFGGGWADVEWWQGTAGSEPETSAPDVGSVDGFAALLDSLLEQWAR